MVFAMCALRHACVNLKKQINKTNCLPIQFLHTLQRHWCMKEAKEKCHLPTEHKCDKQGILAVSDLYTL